MRHRQWNVIDSKGKYLGQVTTSDAEPTDKQIKQWLIDQHKYKMEELGYSTKLNIKLADYDSEHEEAVDLLHIATREEGILAVSKVFIRKSKVIPWNKATKLRETQWPKR